LIHKKIEMEINSTPERRQWYYHKKGKKNLTPQEFKNSGTVVDMFSGPEIIHFLNVVRV